MTAIIYFGEILVASLLAIVLLAISQLRMSSDAVLFASGVVAAWYLFVLHCAHHGPDSLPLSLLKHHQSHHRFASRNYGVSTTLWDHVFGTMLR
jgi:sterol desaturase/sphingolipid hydroxylase (fatty acid hydroxylase superfamily)